MEQYEPRSTATSRRARAALPRLRVRKAGSGDGAAGEGEASAVAGEACTVCHDAFEGGAEVLELPCGHCFHDECISPWLDTHNSCPVCRFELPTEEEGGDEGRAAAAAAASRGGGRAAQRPRSERAAPPPPAAEAGAAVQGGGSLTNLIQNIQESWNRFSGADGGAGGSGAQREQQAVSNRASGLEGERTLRRRAGAGAQGGSSAPQRAGSAPSAPAAAPSARTAGTPSEGVPGIDLPAARPGEDVGGPHVLGMVLGGALGALTGSVLAAWLGSRRA